MNILKITATAMMAATFAACSNIAEDERLVYVEPAKANRNVLIEDFTGQRCVNCPNATIAIHDIQEVYGENVIPVAIHCGPFGIGGNNGLMTETGKEYWNKWFDSSTGQPIAKINRGEATNNYQNWSAEVAKALEKETDVTIECSIRYDEINNEADIYVHTLGKAGRKAKLQVWLTEDEIVAIQMMPDNSTNRQYVHNHVFRTAVNGSWGEEFTYTEDYVTKHYEHIKFEDKWITDNMHAVIFVFDDNEVLQVVQCPIK